MVERNAKWQRNPYELNGAVSKRKMGPGII